MECSGGKRISKRQLAHIRERLDARVRGKICTYVGTTATRVTDEICSGMILRQNDWAASRSGLRWKAQQTAILARPRSAVVGSQEIFVLRLACTFPLDEIPDAFQ